MYSNTFTMLYYGTNVIYDKTYSIIYQMLSFIVLNKLSCIILFNNQRTNKIQTIFQRNQIIWNSPAHENMLATLIINWIIIISPKATYHWLIARFDSITWYLKQGKQNMIIHLLNHIIYYTFIPHTKYLIPTNICFSEFPTKWLSLWSIQKGCLS